MKLKSLCMREIYFDFQDNLSSRNGQPPSSPNEIFMSKVEEKIERE